MRVIGGTAKGRKLVMVPGSSTRPILDRVKTALFDILRPSIQSACVLDLFAGTGSVGIEALSQGAGRCVFVELQRAALQTVAQNLTITGLAAGAELTHQDAFDYLARAKDHFDLIYIAPPQYQGLWSKALRAIAARPELLAAEGRIVVQIDPKEYERLELQNIREQRMKKYGHTLLVFYGPAPLG
jgi:16S rRNA (guanine966-N2)-methyltransferase